MGTEVDRRHFRHQVPKDHRESLDTRMRWLWNQRFGTVQMVFQRTPDMLDRIAATTILQAIMGHDLASIELIFKRLEGGAQIDEQIREQQTMRV